MACCNCCQCACQKPPKLLFVSEDGKHSELYIDGERVNGIREITIRDAYDEFVTHEVEYLTVASGQKEWTHGVLRRGNTAR